ncbi:MAG: hypothetical protein RL297_945 [Pseudomonadota bacterium]|jgi:N-methylhydantoinase B/oxoprolinase/acetone carboxylase alpha subunit
MNANKFEQAFDDGVDITTSLDLSKARRVQQDQVTTDTQSREATLNFTSTSPQAPTPPPETPLN